MVPYQKQLLLQHFMYPRRQVRELVPNPFLTEPTDELNAANHEHLMLSQLDYLKLIVNNTTLWNMRQTILELRVMHKLMDDKSDKMMHSNIQDDISSALTAVFNESQPGNNNDLGLVGLKIHCPWLVGYLIQKLDCNVQKAVLDSCKAMLQDDSEGGLLSFGSGAGGVNSSAVGVSSPTAGSQDIGQRENEKSVENQQILHTPQPFLNLILNSLEGNNQMKDFLVDFLADQINQIIKNLMVSRFN